MLGKGVSDRMASSPSQYTVKILGCREYFSNRAVSIVLSIWNNCFCSGLEHLKKCQVSLGSLWQEGQNLEPRCGWKLEAWSGKLP